MIETKRDQKIRVSLRVAAIGASLIACATVAFVGLEGAPDFLARKI